MVKIIVCRACTGEHRVTRVGHIARFTSPKGLEGETRLPKSLGLQNAFHRKGLPPAIPQILHAPPYPTVTFSPSTMTGTFREPREYLSISSSLSRSFLTFTYGASAP